VPVGDDQKQHLEICRDIATRFNNVYGKVFTVPEPYIAKTGARIKDLQEPTSKMSKSDDANGCIFLLDSPDVIMRKIKRAVTDSEVEIRYDTTNKPGISNLLDIYANLCGISIAEAEAEFAGKTYGVLKGRVVEVLYAELVPMQARFNEFMANADYLDGIMKKNAMRASNIATSMLKKVKKKIGLVQL
jgi:tryptophanyl-tRNA synthetase